MNSAARALIEQVMQLSPEEPAGVSEDAPALWSEEPATAWRPGLDRRRREPERADVQAVDAREPLAGIRARCVAALEPHTSVTRR